MIDIPDQNDSAFAPSAAPLANARAPLPPGSSIPAGSPLTEGAVAVERMRQQMQEHLDQLQSDIVRQQQNLYSLLDQQTATVAEIEQKYRLAVEADQRRVRAERQEELTIELLAALESRADELRQHEKEFARRLQVERDELSRAQNTIAIEAAALDQRLAQLSANEQDAAERRRQLDEQRGELERRASDLTAREESARDRGRQLSHLELQLAALQKELAARQSDLLEQGRLSAQRAGTLDAREQEIEVQQRSLAKRARNLQADADQLHQDRRTFEARREQWEAELLTRKSRLSARLTGMAHWEAALDEREQEIARQNDACRERSENIARQEAALAERSELLARREAELQTELQSLSERTERIVADEHHLQQRLTELADLQSELAGQRISLDGERAALQESRHALLEEQAALASRLEQLGAAETDLRAEAEALHRERDELQHARAELASARRQLEVEREQLQSEREQLAAQGDRQRQLETELAELQNRLAETQSAEADRARELEELRAALAQERAELDARANDLDQERQDVRRREESLQQERSQLHNEREAFTQERDAGRRQLEQERAELEQRRRELEEQRRELDEQRRELAERKDSETQQANLVEDAQQLQAELDRQRAELEERRAELAEAEARIDRQRGELNVELERIDAARQELKVRGDEVQQAQDHLELERRRLASDAAAFEAQRDAQQQREAAQQVEQENNAYDLEAERQRLQEEWSALDEEYAHLDAIRERLERQADGLEEERRLHEVERAYADHERRRLDADAADLQAELLRLAEREMELHELLTAAEGAAGEDGSFPESTETITAEVADVASAADQSTESETPAEVHVTEIKADTAATDPAPDVDDLGLDLAGLLDDTENSFPGAGLSAFPSGPDRSADATAEAPPHRAPVAEWDSANTLPPDASLTEPTPDQAISGDSQWPDEGVEHDDDAPTAEELEVRSRLAEMFGISNTPRTPVAGGDDGETNRRARGLHELSASADDDEDGPRLGELLSSLDRRTGDEPPCTERAAEHRDALRSDLSYSTDPYGSPASTSASEASGGDDDDEDSVARYMEQLLARTRQRMQGMPEQPSAPQRASSAARLDTVVYEPVRSRQSFLPMTSTEDGGTPAQSEPTGSNAVEVHVPLAPAPDAPPPEPVHRTDKEALRADINSLRELANLSARSAIAAHTSKKLRNSMFVRSLLTAIAFTVAVVLLTSELWGDESYAATGWVALVIGIFMAIELTRSTLLMHRLSSLRDSEAKDAEGARKSGPTESIPAETSGGADLYEIADDEERREEVVDEEVEEEAKTSTSEIAVSPAPAEDPAGNRPFALEDDAP